MNEVPPLIFKPDKFNIFLSLVFFFGLTYFFWNISLDEGSIYLFIAIGSFVLSILSFIFLVTNRVKLIVDENGITSFSFFKKKNHTWNSMSEMYILRTGTGFIKNKTLVLLDKSGKEHVLQAHGHDIEEVIKIYEDMKVVNSLNL
jgi:hypothetical protein